MSQRDEARDFLNSVFESRAQWQRFQARVRALEEQCTQISAKLESSPGGSGDVHKDWALIDLADQLTMMRAREVEYRAKEDAVSDFIDRIPDHRYRVILRLRYLDLLTWPRIRDRLQDAGIYYEERNIFRLHGQALNAARGLWEQEHRKDEEHGQV